jgi:hypothetical protein
MIPWHRGHVGTLAPGSCRYLGPGVGMIPWHRGSSRAVTRNTRPGHLGTCITPRVAAPDMLVSNAQLPDLSISGSIVNILLISRLNIRSTFGDRLTSLVVSVDWTVGYLVWYGMVWYGMVW